MDKYQKLDCVKGLLMSMDSQLNNYFQKDNLPKNLKNKIVDKYFEAVQELLDKGEPTNDSEDLPEVTDNPSGGEPHTRG